MDGRVWRYAYAGVLVSIFVGLWVVVNPFAPPPNCISNWSDQDGRYVDEPVNYTDLSEGAQTTVRTILSEERTCYGSRADMNEAFRVIGTNHVVKDDTHVYLMCQHSDQVMPCPF